MLDTPIDYEKLEAEKREAIARRVADINAFATCLDHIIARPVRQRPVLRVIEGGRHA